MENVEDIFTLTPVQQGILYHCIQDSDSNPYISQVNFSIRGPLNPDIFKAAFEQLYNSHPTLRSIFLWEEIDQPLQVVREKIALNWITEDWQDAGNFKDQLEARKLRDRQGGFDLARAPLSRMTLIQVSERSFHFIWSFHHLLMDGWSVAALLNELKEVYQTKHSDTATADQASRPLFRDFTHWVNEQNLAKVELFWKDQLSELTKPLILELIRSNSNEIGHSTQKKHLSVDLSQSLKAYCNKQHITLNTLIHGAWALLLNRYTGREDIVFGTTVSGRSCSFPKIEDMVGCCINTLPFTSKVPSGQKVDTWLKFIQEKHLSIREFEHSPLNQIHKWFGLKEGALFNTIVVFENYPPVTTETEKPYSFKIEDLDIIEHSNYPLALLVVPSPGSITLHCIHDNKRFDSAIVVEILNCIESILTSLISPEINTLGEVEVMSTGTLEQIQNWSRGPEVEFPDTVLAAFRDNAHKLPNKIAVVYENRSLTYSELDNRSNLLCYHLQLAGIQPGDRVALRVDKSISMIVGILGILKSGAAYVPIEPSYPDLRQQQMIDVAQAELLVTDHPASESAKVANTIYLSDLDWGSVIQPEVVEILPSTLAYVIFTSGSTGRPKPVGVTHANLAYSTAARLEFYKAIPERFLLLSPFTFDSSVAGIFWTMVAGSTLVLPKDKLEQDMEALSRLILSQKITHTLCLPSLIELLLEYAPPGSLQSLQVVISAGEPCPSSLPGAFFERLPNGRLFNCYGPTETTVWASVKEITRNTPLPVSIGTPIPGTSTFVLNSLLQPVPAGVPGELYIGSPGVTPGYFGYPDETRDCFITSPTNPGETLYKTGDIVCWSSDGDLIFLGRSDNQLKIRGHRIEIAEIETALRSHPAVREAIVTTDVNSDVDRLLVLLEQLPPEKAEQFINEVQNTGINPS